jgi:hypothetical protein
MDGPGLAIQEHPDLAEMQARYDGMAQTPTLQFIEGLTLTGDERGTAVSSHLRRVR